MAIAPKLVPCHQLKILKVTSSNIGTNSTPKDMSKDHGLEQALLESLTHPVGASISFNTFLFIKLKKKLQYILQVTFPNELNQVEKVQLVFIFLETLSQTLK